MASWLLFILFSFGVLGIILLYSYVKDKEKTINLLKSKEKKEKNIRRGWWLFLGVGILLTSMCSDAQEGSWFNYVDVYLGVDNIFDVSPMCEQGDLNDKFTSNGGLDFNIYQSYNKRFEWNTHYLHHSCALNTDNLTYDAIGFKITYRLWSK